MLRRHASWLILAFSLSAFGGGEPPDPKDWTPVRITGEQSIPEFEDIGEWVNSDPLTVKDLKGKVVVVHFMAFG